MVRTIMALFGYVKIPKEVVALSMLQENFLIKCSEAEQDERGVEYFKKAIDAQFALTDFLRSGRF